VDLGGENKYGMGMRMNYTEFLESKRVVDQPTGITIDASKLNPMLYEWQRDIVAWSLFRGRAAIFAACGMGKTPMQLTWAHHVPGKVLILAPLAVAHQTIREGQKFGTSISYSRDGSCPDQITIANYEMFEAFNPADFTGIVLDESSILKSYMGKTKQALVKNFSSIPFRLCCTATPAPNDHMELGNHAEFLGVMDSNEMLARWFINDTMHAGTYRLKKHGSRDFWRWVSGWAVALSKPSDIGSRHDDKAFKLPPLRIEVETVESEPPDGFLFHVGGTLSATEIHKVKRQSAEARAHAAAAFADGSKDQCLIWCDSNYESEAIAPLIPDAIEVRGSDSPERKSQVLDDFADGKIRVLITKPSIAGFGMNFQNCHRVVFVGLSYSFEALYQATRRTWRFGQKSAVDILIIEADGEAGIRGVVDRKMRDYETMQTEMVANMSEWQKDKSRALKAAPEPTKEEGQNWTMWHGDCVQVSEKIEADTIHFSVFSPPFSNLYIYSDSIADMGNSVDNEEFLHQMSFLIRQIYRITINGRLCAIHCKDLPAYKGRDGAAGLIDFPGMLIKAFEQERWQYHSRVTIWKDPVTEMQRTKNHGLLHKQLCKDSAASRQGMADYMLVFRKWDGDEFPAPVHGESKEVRFDPKEHEYIGENGPEGVRSDRDYSIQVWQRYASPVWFDIRQQRVLQGKKHATSEEDERHICPLQLDVIERSIQLWSNKGDVVFSPFGGIGSEGYCAVKMGRKFVGIELKDSYWKMACDNLNRAGEEMKRQDLL
jgi:superfamily II DNA or RNA helicase